MIELLTHHSTWNGGQDEIGVGSASAYPKMNPLWVGIGCLQILQQVDELQQMLGIIDDQAGYPKMVSGIPVDRAILPNRDATFLFGLRELDQSIYIHDYKYRFPPGQQIFRI